MTAPAEIVELFDFHADTPQIVGFGSDAALLRERDSQATAVAVAVQLLRPKDKTPSGKFLWLQVQPADALKLAASILSHAQEKQWPIDPELWGSIQRIQLQSKAQRH